MGCSAWGWDTQQMDMGCREQGLGWEGCNMGIWDFRIWEKGCRTLVMGCGAYRVWDLWIWDRGCRIWDVRYGVVAMGCGIRDIG